MLARCSRSGLPLVVAGVLVLLAGLGWDAVLHRLDPALAAREGVFSLTNPGHVLFGAGIGLIVLGLAVMLAGRLAGWRGMGAGRRLARLAPLALLLGLAPASIGLALASGTAPGRHTHTAEEVHVHDDGSVHNHAEHEAFIAQQGTPAAGSHSHDASPTMAGDAGQSRHQHKPDIPITAADLTTLNQQLAIAREATEKYQDVRLALQDGYRQATQDLPGIAAHFVHPRYNSDRIFDPAKPEILLYAKLDGAWTLVGMSYSMPQNGDEVEPEGFAGPLDVWHYHSDLCFKGPRVISAGQSAEACGAAGGIFQQRTAWMMHLWMWYDSPEGLFSHENSRLKGSGAVLTAQDLAAMH